MGEMMLGAAHELNNPITAILGLSEVLCDHNADESDRRRAPLIQEHARRASRIVQSLLAFSRRPERSGLPVRPHDVVERALYVHDKALNENGMRWLSMRRRGFR
jgi:signal transduction histidine kinase